MHGFKRITWALMAAGLVVAPAMAAEADEMKARVAELEQRVKELDKAVGNVPKNFNLVTQGEEAGYIKSPGGQTAFNIYGYAHLALYKDSKARNVGDWAASIGDQPAIGAGGDERSGKYNMTARQSRFGIKTLTLTDLGTLRTKIEGDFVQSREGKFTDGADNTARYTNGYQLRLRHAYGELSGDWGSLLAGQNWSNFLSGDAIPETLDFNGSGSTNALRNPQLRYTKNFEQAGSLAVAIENGWNLSGSGRVNDAGSDNLQRRPDVTANWTKTFDWGFVSAQALNSQWYYDNVTSGEKAKKYGNGWGLSAQFKATPKDTFVVQTNGGKGLGRYVALADYYGYGYNTTSKDIELAKTKHWSFGYARAWTDVIRTNVALSGTTGKNGDGSDGNKYSEGFVNVIYGIAQNTEVGLEYYAGKAKFRNDSAVNSYGNPDGSEGKASRILATLQYNF